MCKIPDGFRYSFSKLELYRHCPMAFYMRYIEQDKSEDEGNAYAEYGTYVHGILEQYSKGYLLDFMLADVFDAGYEDAIKHDFPPYPKGAWETYRQQGHDYLEQFTGYGDNYEILEVEDKFTFDLFGYTISGIADLILRDKDTGDIVIIDHKSKSKSSMMKDLPVYIHQQYIYAHHVLLKYGVFPKKLVFNVFRENYMLEQDFTEDGYNAAIKWIMDTIQMIESDKDWTVNMNSFYCRNICDCFNSCPMRDAILTPVIKTYEYNGQEKSAREWAEEFGMNTATLTRRLNKGMTVAEAIAVPQKKNKTKES